MANQCIHGTVGEVPQVRFDECEAPALRPYLTPVFLDTERVPGTPRKADKTGLVSFQDNQYSVPMVLPSRRWPMHIYHLHDGQGVASHRLS
ncbi:MAG: hypothetical protein GKR94_28730 [Gammaproteobacteria bacterium]|nr:hypothetical protein [Gammaproteobacteria bacterium]